MDGQTALWTAIKINIQTDSSIDGKTERQTSLWTEIQINRQTVSWLYRQTDFRDISKDSQMDKEVVKKTQ